MAFAEPVTVVLQGGPYGWALDKWLHFRMSGDDPMVNSSIVAVLLAVAVPFGEAVTHADPAPNAEST